jgi:hypothetical protein
MRAGSITATPLATTRPIHRPRSPSLRRPTPTSATSVAARKYRSTSATAGSSKRSQARVSACPRAPSTTRKIARADSMSTGDQHDAFRAREL